MKAADIPDEAVLDIVRMYNEGHQPPKTIPGRTAWVGMPWAFEIPPYTIPPGPSWCLIWDLEERLPGFPRKVITAKCRQLIKRGLLEGCTCGCRGDYYIPGGLWG